VEESEGCAHLELKCQQAGIVEKQLPQQFKRENLTVKHLNTYVRGYKNSVNYFIDIK